MHLENTAIGLVKPGDDQDFVAGVDIAQRSLDIGFELDPSLGRSFVPLIRSRRQVDERGRDPAHRLQHERLCDVLLRAQDRYAMVSAAINPGAGGLVSLPSPDPTSKPNRLLLDPGLRREAAWSR